MVDNKKKRSKQDYNPNEIEPKWQKIWNEAKVYSPNLDTAKRPFYNLMMFPYPSAEGMHVGNMYAFTGADVYGRFKRMQGNDVFEPIGLDGFGIHSENYAIKVGQHPKEQAKISEKNFYRQLHATGNGFDWSRKLETYDPKYYKWTQWLFIQLFKAGLAYRKKSPVNFCPLDKTVLADEQVIEGKCERCSSVVEKRELEQWFFKITKYANRLLANLAKLDWSEKVKIAQRNWIGKSEGLIFTAPIKGSSLKIQTFSAHFEAFRADTFVVIAPDHPLLEKLIEDVPNKKEILDFSNKIVQKRKSEGKVEEKKPEGIFTGKYIVDPVGNGDLPIWVANYAIKEYGTGIVKCSAHDERDFEFAKKYGIRLKPVLFPKDPKHKKRVEDLEECYTDMVNGYLTEPDEFVEKRARDVRQEVVKYVVRHALAEPKTQYHLRDWLISRQRYWGPPIPMIYCKSCAKKGNSRFTLTKKSPHKEDYLVNLKADSLSGWPDTLESNISKQNKNVNSEFRKGMDSPGVEPGRFGVSSQPSRPAEPMPESAYKKDNEFVNDWDSAGWFSVPEDQLPVLLPNVKDWKPKGSGKSPLANVESFVNTTCPNCGAEAKRETDVSDTFLDSAWYFLRYVSTDIESTSFDIERVKKWLPVEMYIGGAEHSVLHLLYSRFITMVLKDLGFIEFDEPFSRFYAHGLLVKEGAKMSKSKGNVVVPDQYINKFGADTLRMYLMFLGPFNQGGDFYDTGIEGMHRFLNRVYRLISEATQKVADQNAEKRRSAVISVYNQPESASMMHKTIKKVTEDIKHLRYNTAIAALMEWYNYLNSELRTQNLELTKEEIETYLKLLAPFAPHVAEELYQRFKIYDLRFKNKKEKNHKSYFINHKSFYSIHLQPWPKFDPKFLEEDEVTIVVQVNGKVRETIKVESGKLKVESYVEELARKSEKVRKYLEGKEVKKVVYVEGKVINFVTE